ncbi:MAG: hypothetical protein PHS96_06575 [Anaerolineales bacterium]|nr:hypothetical protein [Anaerolineales bacterium]
MIQKRFPQSYRKILLIGLTVVALSLVIPAESTWGARLFQTLPTPGSLPTKKPPVPATQGPISTTRPRPARTATPSPISSLSPAGMTATAAAGSLLPTGSVSPEISGDALTATASFAAASTSYPAPLESLSPPVAPYPSPEMVEQVSPYPEALASPTLASVPPTPTQATAKTGVGLQTSGLVLIIVGAIVVLGGLVWFLLRRSGSSPGA